MAYKVCSNCIEENSETASVCFKCSHPLHTAELVGIPFKEKTQRSLIHRKKEFCQNCSERLDEEALKCKYCGTMTVTAPNNYNRDYSYTRSNINAAIVLLYTATLFIPLVGLIVGGFYALDNDPEKSDIGKGLVIFGLIMLIVSFLLWQALG
jgi:uncharacterized membrane protein YvbJ